MRLVQVTVPDGMRRDVVELLEDEGIDYVVTEATDDPDYAAAFFFPLPTEAVERVEDSLTGLGVDEAGHSVVISAETVVSQDFDELQAAYGESSEPGDLVALEELRTQAREFLPSPANHVLLSVVSAVVATAGLLLDSAAIVVGAMVIAPLVGPAMATSVGTVLYEQDLFRTGVKYQLVGFVLTVVSATGFATVARQLFLVPPTVDVTSIEQVAGRLSPDLLVLVVAVGAGVAGARSLSGDVPSAFVGVVIAAALVPPAAAVGIGVAWGLPGVVFDAGLTVLVNALSINLAALGTLWYSGYRPIDWATEDRARFATERRFLVLLVAVLALTALLGTFTLTAYRTADTTQSIRSDVETVLDDPTYEALSSLDTTVRYGGGLIKIDPVPRRVVVTVTRPNGDEYPALADRIERRVESGIDDDVTVEVRYVDVDSAG